MNTDILKDYFLRMRERAPVRTAIAQILITACFVTLVAPFFVFAGAVLGAALGLLAAFVALVFFIASIALASMKQSVRSVTRDQ